MRDRTLTFAVQEMLGESELEYNSPELSDRPVSI